MASGLSTTVSELPESRVRVEVDVPAREIDRSLEHKARELGRTLKLPGFRRGKVPAALVIQRLGRDVVLEDAVRDQLGDWYVDAIATAQIVPVGDPTLAPLGVLPAPGEHLRFTFEIGVLPKATLGAYRDLEVGRAEPTVPEERIDEEIDQLRSRLARLHTAERPAEPGDFVVLDYLGSLVSSAQVGTEGAEGEGAGAGRGGGVGADDEGRGTGERDDKGAQAEAPGDGEEEAGAGGAGPDGGHSRSTGEPFPGGEGRDQLVELGSGRLIEGFESALVGAGAGERRTLDLTFPADYDRADLAGRPARFEVTVKEVKRKELPPVDDDLAIDTGFDSLDELRADIRARLLEVEQSRIEREFAQDALDAAVEQATVTVPPALVEGRAHEMWERILHTLSHRGISREAYLQISDRTEEQSLQELAPDAERALRREAVLSAIVAAEQIEPTEQDLLDSLAPTAEREQSTPQDLLARLRDAGRLEELREELATRRAAELIAGSAQPIPLEQARARDALWTPEKERAEHARQSDAGAAAPGEPASEAGGLWTPGR